MKRFEVVPQIFLNAGVGTHSQGEQALGSSQPAGTLDKPLAKSGQLFEEPQGCTFGRSFAQGLAGLHLQLAIEIVGEYRSEQIGLVAEQSSGGYVVHLTLGLELGKDRLLGAATVVKGYQMPSRDSLIGHHDLELVVVIVGDEEVELHRPVGANGSVSADDEQPEAATPTLGFPMRLEVGNTGVEAPPEVALFDDLLELREAFKGHGDGEIDSEAVQGSDDSIAEKGTVHPHLDTYARQGSSNRLNAFQNELLGTVRIVNVTGAEEEVENLASLGHGAEQGVVAPLPLLLAIEADRCAFSPPIGAEHRAVEVKGDSAWSKALESLQNQTPQEPAQLVEHGRCDLGQDPADRSDMRQAP